MILGRFSRTRRRFAIAAMAGLTVATLPGAWAQSTHVSASPVGCDGSLQAVPHYLNGQPATPKTQQTLVPCKTIVGPSTETAMVGVASNGEVFYAPDLDLSSYEGTPAPTLYEGLPCTEICPDELATALVAHTQDGGANWSAQGPYSTPSHGPIVTWMSVDPTTNRVWMANPYGCGEDVSWSDDLGKTWTTNPLVGCPAQGGMSMFEGPAPAGQPQPVGYPHVVYLCANAVDAGPNLMFCYRSLNGGTAFSFVGSFPNVIPPPASCQTSSGLTTLTRPRGRAVGPDGTIYMSVDECGVLALGVSHDEGATWNVTPIATTAAVADMNTASVAVDHAGDVYIAWKGAGNKAYMVASSDRGRTWSAPENVTAPGVQQVAHVAIAAAHRGHVVVAYLGTTDGTNYTGYLTESFDALSADPLLWSSPVTGVGQPLMTSAQVSAAAIGGRTFSITAAFGPDGTPYAGFHCAVFTSCPAPGGNQGKGGSWTGVVAQLSSE